MEWRLRTNRAPRTRRYLDSSRLLTSEYRTMSVGLGSVIPLQRRLPGLVLRSYDAHPRVRRRVRGACWQRRQWGGRADCGSPVNIGRLHFDRWCDRVKRRVHRTIGAVPLTAWSKSAHGCERCRRSCRTSTRFSLARPRRPRRLPTIRCSGALGTGGVRRSVTFGAPSPAADLAGPTSRRSCGALASSASRGSPRPAHPPACTDVGDNRLARHARLPRPLPSFAVAGP